MTRLFNFALQKSVLLYSFLELGGLDDLLDLGATALDVLDHHGFYDDVHGSSPALDSGTRIPHRGRDLQFFVSSRRCAAEASRGGDRLTHDQCAVGY